MNISVARVMTKEAAFEQTWISESIPIIFLTRDTVVVRRNIRPDNRDIYGEVASGLSAPSVEE
jgi:hypothetical protein